MSGYNQMHPLQNIRESQYFMEMQYRIQQEVLKAMMIPAQTLYYHYQPPPQARTKLDNWTSTLSEDLSRNDKAISSLEPITNSVAHPVALEDLALMKIELGLRKALKEVLKQRLSTDSARQASGRY